EATRIGVPQVITILVLTGGAAGSLYYTDYLPSYKNHLLTAALLVQNTFSSQVEQGVNPTVSPTQIIDAFQTALNFHSPVGQEETISMFQKFVIYLVDLASRNPD